MQAMGGGTMMLRHLLSVLLLPAVVVVGIPYVIVTRTSESGSWSTWPLPGIIGTIVGIASIAAGLALVGVTVWHFGTVGRGTLAPWDPPRRLVVTGVYRYVRNPMISGVFLVLLGEGLVLKSTGVLLWAMGFFVINAIYIPLVEEPGLERRFGAPYAEYRRHVPRWIPRRTPWIAEAETEASARSPGERG